MIMVRPERFELPTNRFEAGYSIQLSYGRAEKGAYDTIIIGKIQMQPVYGTFIEQKNQAYAVMEYGPEPLIQRAV